ncbi:MAG: nucleotidyltransferase [Bacteroidetes bacterium]|nr:nucleotidyltransferase [Bacteroidota bacterium]MBL6944558.1 nucleotidyltransferase [Bacteroidales bacterium]
MSPTLLILAAGIGSRYGGVKQMDKIGPSGESIIDYSVFDAIRAGFGKVIFVLNPKIEKDFKEVYEARLKGKIETGYVLQEVKAVPYGVPVNTARVKPWGTGHAVLVAKNDINEPFAVINADDFYGRQAFELLGDFLSKTENDSTKYAMVGYKLKNTLSENGSVSRGVCQTKNGFLTDVVERTKITIDNDKIVYMDNGENHEIGKDSVVSMNFWGFSPLFFDQLESDFNDFMEENASDLKAEFFIPSVVNDLISNDVASIKMLKSNDQWFGVTYKEDKEITINKVADLITQGVYPANLWK